jgi:prevent-host-death family protein
MEFAKRLSKMLDRVQAGERIVVTRNGKDVATLGAVEQRDVAVMLRTGREAPMRIDPRRAQALADQMVRKPKKG